MSDVVMRLMHRGKTGYKNSKNDVVDEQRRWATGSEGARA